MITRLKLSTIEQGLPKYRSMLAGNDAFIPNSFESIATANGTGGSATITFSSIPSGYQHLQIRGRIRSTDTVSTYIDTLIRFNSDTGSNYVYHSLYGSPSTTTATGAITQTSARILRSATNDLVTANVLGTVIIDIHDYASTTKNKTVRVFSGNDRSDANGTVGLSSGLWRNTNAVTSISLLCNTGAWTTQTQFALYGIKGA
jgi:hypothetical protein